MHLLRIRVPWLGAATLAKAEAEAEARAKAKPKATSKRRPKLSQTLTQGRKTEVETSSPIPQVWVRVRSQRVRG